MSEANAVLIQPLFYVTAASSQHQQSQQLSRRANKIPLSGPGSTIPSSDLIVQVSEVVLIFVSGLLIGDQGSLAQLSGQRYTIH